MARWQHSGYMECYTYLVHLKLNVEGITVIERSKDVIELFKTYVLQQFTHTFLYRTRAFAAILFL